MALKRAGMVKSVSGTTEISLAAGPDESFLVRDIMVFNPTGTHLTLTVGRATVGYFRISGSQGNHLQYPPGGGDANRAGNKTLLGLLGEMGHFRGYPVPSGYTLSGSGAAQSGCFQSVIYDVYDPGDIREDQANGPKANELDYVIYGNSGATIATAAAHLLDTVVNPAEFATFPFGGTVPSKTNITVHGVLCSTFAPSENDGTDDVATSYLRFTKDREVLFDEDRNGILLEQALGSQSGDQVGDGQSPIGNYNDVDNRSPLFFDPPLVCGEGTELLLHYTTKIDGTGANILIADQETGLIVTSVRS
jgi:hypothetical protein